MATNHAGKVIGGRYTLISQLATGGMGEVWSARDQVTARKVAVKVLKTELAGQEAFLTRLRIEAQNAMQINHPNLATVLDHGELHGVGWIVMELVVGRPLNEFLVKGNRLTPAQLLPVLMQIAQALQAAQTQAVVHRDIKPSNLLVTAEGVVKLTDFGISTTPNQAALTDVGMVMGTAQYLSPEQAMGEAATHLSDMYSLGVIAYEAIAGRRPFTGKTQVDIAFAHVNESVPELPADTPVPLRKIILKMLRKHPKDRYADFSALIRELLKVAKQLDLSVAPCPLRLPQPVGDFPREREVSARGRRLPSESRRRLAPSKVGSGRPGFSSSTASADLSRLFSPYGPVYGKRSKVVNADNIRHRATDFVADWVELAAAGAIVFVLSFALFFAASQEQDSTVKPNSQGAGSLPALSLENTPAEVEKW